MPQETEEVQGVIDRSEWQTILNSFQGDDNHNNALIRTALSQIMQSGSIDYMECCPYYEDIQAKLDVLQLPYRLVLVRVKMKPQHYTLERK